MNGSSVIQKEYQHRPYDLYDKSFDSFGEQSNEFLNGHNGYDYHLNGHHGKEMSHQKLSNNEGVFYISKQKKHHEELYIDNGYDRYSGSMHQGNKKKMNKRRKKLLERHEGYE